VKDARHFAADLCAELGFLTCDDDAHGERERSSSASSQRAKRPPLSAALIGPTVADFLVF
jgi:hypothetical protein